MKKFIILALLASTSGILIAQRIGIRTQNPQATLHIAGTCRIDTVPVDTSAVWILGIDAQNQITRQSINLLQSSTPVNHDSMVRTRSFFEIEIYERAPVPWFDAATICYQAGKRLCTLEEWFVAGSDNSLPLENMGNGWEWVSSTGQGTTFKIIGSPNLQTMSNALASGTYSFRCCVSP